MRDRIHELIAALREELQQYGEMLALLDQQQDYISARASDELFQTVAAIQMQARTIEAARFFREEKLRSLAVELGLVEESSMAELMLHLPEDYRPLLDALVQENNELLVRIQQRARQNHLLLRRCLDLMQTFLNTLMPGRESPTYTEAGAAKAGSGGALSVYEAVG